jgi:hypothetical protein
MTVKRNLLFKIPSTKKEVRVSQIRVDGTEAIEIRDFYPDVKRFGRGILLDPQVFKRLVQEDGPALVAQRWPQGSPGAGQEKLF